MNKSLYRKALSLLLASCMTLGSTATALAPESSDKLAEDATPWVELQPSTKPQPEEVTPPSTETPAPPVTDVVPPSTDPLTPPTDTAAPPTEETAPPTEVVPPADETVPPAPETTPLLPLEDAQQVTLAADPPVEAPANSNLARPTDATVTATASSEEDNVHTASKAIDGDRSTKDSRWATVKDADKPTLSINLGKMRRVQSVAIYWEPGLKTSTSNAENYEIQTSSVPNPQQDSDWQTQATRTSKAPAPGRELISFEKPVDAQHVRLVITKYSNKDWNNISVYEMEVYQEAEPASASSVLQKLTYDVRGDQLVVGNIPDDYAVEVGANYEQVVGAKSGETTTADGKLEYTYPIYQPLVNMNVELDITVSKGNDVAKTQAKKLEIPGAHQVNEGNTKPRVIPELTEWYSSADQQGQNYSLTSASRIVADGALSGVAAELQKDIKDMFGYQLEITSGGAQAGDIVLTLQTDLPGYDKETYSMDVQDIVTVTATDSTGVYWGTRSVLQALKLSGDQTIAQGAAKDYPEFKVRGFMFDVGRKPMSMHQLKNFAKTMAWYKMNDFHVHLSDNLIFMEDYAKTDDQLENAWNAYDGFRLESDIKGPITGRPLASPDYHYTKQEFGDFIKECSSYGINVVPELDVPAHALSFTKILREEDPDFVLNRIGTFWDNTRPWIDHVNVSNPAAVQRVKDLFREYIESTEQAFGGTETVIHIGADEFYASASDYRAFLKEMIRFIRDDMGRQIRVWGSLKAMNEGPFTEADVKGAQMNIWSLGWADPQAMVDMGFSIVNTLDTYSYIVPTGGSDRGAYKDFLDTASLYPNYQPNKMGDTIVPASSDKMLGSAFAIWQDGIDTRASGLDEQDTFYRFIDAVPTMSVKMWGEGGDGLDRANVDTLNEDAAKIGTAPNTDPYQGVDKKESTSEHVSYKFDDTTDSSGNGHTLTLNNAALSGGILSLSGGSSYAETGLGNLTWGDGIQMRVKKVGNVQGEEEILLEGEHAYGDYAIKALPGSKEGTWRLGFSRELYDYTFEVDLPTETWLDLSVSSQRQKTTLTYAGRETAAVGRFKPDENSNSQFKGKEGITSSSFCLPITRIGSKTNAFVGEIDYVTTGEALPENPISQGQYDLPLDAYKGVTAGNAQSNEPASNVLDNKPNTLWHTDWNGSDIKDSWITVELNEMQTVSGLRCLPRQEGTNGIITEYKIETSKDNVNWEPAAEGAWGSPSWQSAFFDAREAKYIRLTACKTLSSQNKHFASAAEIRVIATPSLADATIKLDPFYTLADGKSEPKPAVLLNGYKLAEGIDYSLSYTNNTAPGTGTLTVTGKGVYTGSVSAQFTIAKESSGGDSTPSKPTDPEKPNPPVTPDSNTDFTDVNTNDWFYPAVTDVIDRGLMNGMPNGTFAPQSTMTRAMLVSVLHRLAGEPSAPLAGFKDVPSNAYYADAVSWAEQQGIVTGLNDTTFAPGNMVTREQIAVMLYRYAKKNQLDTTASGDLTKFQDAGKVSSYAAEALTWAVSKGLVTGDDNAKLNPSGQATRAETAAMLSRFAAMIDNA